MEENLNPAGAINEEQAVNAAREYFIKIGLGHIIEEREVKVEKAGKRYKVIFIPKKASRAGRIIITLDRNGAIISTEYWR